MVLLCSAGSSYAQGDADSSTGVVVHADPRLAVLLKKPTPTGIYSSRGYRVQIYSGNDRGKATRIKIDFARRYPGVRTYMTYVQPQFRVKVGDYQTRQEAKKMYDQVSTLYTPCMIVPDFIVVNTLREKKDD
jgi:hypothetical protein